MSNNAPYSELRLTKEEHEFLVENCESNIQYGLKALTMAQNGNVSMEAAAKIVALNEKFKSIYNKLKKSVL